MHFPIRFVFASVTLAALFPLAVCQAAAVSGAAGTAGPTALSPARIADHVVRSNIAGIDIIACKTGVEEVVNFHGSLPAGDRFNPAGNVAIATLVGEMLDKGTAHQDKFAIAGQLEGVGATISIGTSSSMLEFSGKCLKKDLPLVIRLLAEQLRTPAFSPEELVKVKQQLIGACQRQLESTDYRAGLAFADALFPLATPTTNLPPILSSPPSRPRPWMS